MAKKLEGARQTAVCRAISRWVNSGLGAFFDPSDILYALSLTLFCQQHDSTAQNAVDSILVLCA